MKSRAILFFVILVLNISANAQTESQTFFKKFNCLMTTQWADNDLKQFLDKNGFEMRYVLPDDTMRFAKNTLPSSLRITIPTLALYPSESITYKPLIIIFN